MFILAAVDQLTLSPQVEDFEDSLTEIKEKEKVLESRKTGLMASKVQIESFRNEKHLAVLKDMTEQIDQVEGQLQKFRELRYSTKIHTAVKNEYSNEGNQPIPLTVKLFTFPLK